MGKELAREEMTAHQLGERRFGALFSVGAQQLRVGGPSHANQKTPQLKSDGNGENPLHRRAARHDIAAKGMGYFEFEFFSINFWSAACCSGVVA